MINTMLTSMIIFVAILQTVYMQKNVDDSCTFNNSRQRGVCRLITDCSTAREEFEKYRVIPTRCGFRGNTVIVCCSDSRRFDVVERIDTEQVSKKRISVRKCEKYGKPVTSTLSVLPLLLDAAPITSNIENCEYDLTQLIVGGQPVKKGEFPHMAAIGWELLGGRGYEWNCGGSLISENFVLTAAHCFHLEGEYERDGEPTTVRLGEFDLTTTDDDTNVQDIDIEQIIAHPDYKFPKKYNDIGLLKLATSAKLGLYVRPACLWTKSAFEDNKAIATGWGLTSEGGEKSAVLQRVTLHIMSQSLCSKAYQKSRRLPEGVIDSQFCAGFATGGRDTCQGDSGGPLQVRTKSNRCIHYIIGLTSFGGACGEAGSGGIYTKVSTYVDWIERNVWPDEF